MKKTLKTSILLPFLLLITVASCTKKKNAGNVVTSRIQYDVFIQSTDNQSDWWVQNIEGSKREPLVKHIFDKVLNGNVKAYEFNSLTLLKPIDVQTMLKKVDTISVERATPPYDLVDTVMVREIRVSDIKKLRFLEAWQMNDKSLAFTKEVIGICPMVEKLDEKGEIFGYRPLFWVFFNDKYPGEMLIK